MPPSPHPTGDASKGDSTINTSVRVGGGGNGAGMFWSVAEETGQGCLGVSTSLPLCARGAGKGEFYLQIHQG